MKSQKIIVTGGSGFIGTNVVDYLLNNEYKVLNLDINPPKNFTHQKVWEKVDILDFKLLTETLKNFNPQYILHLAADLGMDHKNLDNLRCNIDGVENIIKASKLLSSLKRIVFTSSLLVCRNGYIPKNDTDYNPPNFYGQSKMIGEEKVRSGNLICEWVIVRPTAIWGPWFEYSYNAFFRMIDKNHYVHIGRKEFQKPACYVGNTVFMMIQLLLQKNQKINQSTFYLADYPWYSTREWANIIQKTLSTKAIKTAPLFILKIIAFLGDIIKWLFHFDPPLTSFRLKNMLTGGSYPISKTKNICGELPYNIRKAVYLTSFWMFEKKLIVNKPKEIKL